jgi:hypothetical protein
VKPRVLPAAAQERLAANGTLAREKASSCKEVGLRLSVETLPSLARGSFHNNLPNLQLERNVHAF